MYPLAICAACIVTSIIGTFFVKLGANNSIMGALYKGLIATGVLSILGLAIATTYVIGWGEIGTVAGRSVTGPHLFVCGLLGLVVTGLIVVITEYYTGTGKRPVVSIAQASVTGHGTNVIQGLAVSLESTALPALVIVAGIVSTYQLAGLFGTAIAVTTMLGLAGMIVALDAFGPVTDNAGGIAEMAGLPKEVRQSTDALDAVGNTTKAVTKGYAIGSAGLGAIVLFAAYTNDIRHFTETGAPYFKELGEVSFELSNPYVVAGLIFGGLIPYLFGGIAMTAVGRAAGSVVLEVRRQFKEMPGIMNGTQRPDYGRAVDLLTKAAIREMIVPSLLPVLGALRRLFRGAVDLGLEGVGFRRARRFAPWRDRQRPLRRHLDDLGRRRVGQRQEELRGRLRRQGRQQVDEGLGAPQGRRHRRHRRRPLQGHRRPRGQSGDQDHQHRRAAAAGDPSKVRACPVPVAEMSASSAHESRWCGDDLTI